MTQDELKAVAKAFKYGSVMYLKEWDTHLFSKTVPVAVQAKERPRTGKNGHVYTPKKTQDCELAIREQFASCPMFLHPVKLSIKISERVPKIKTDGARFLRPSKSDLDNKVKTVTDALNGVLYRDDRQISSIVAECVYTINKPTLEVEVRRSGLSVVEWENVKKLLPYV